MQYKRFSDFCETPKPLDGKKCNIETILNCEILITGYKITHSKYGDNDCLTLQFKNGDENQIIFTGSSVLIDQVKKYNDKIPFITTIQKIDRYFVMT